jgi:hypothetical protein
MTYLPSKKFIKIFGFTVLGLGAATALVLSLNTNKTEVENPVLVAVNEANSIFEVDSDDDGIADWEEALWGTSPYNSDTDGDGQSDFVYIEAQKIAKAESSGISVDEDDNETEALAKQIFATTVAYQEKGLSSAQAFQELSQTLGSRLEQTADLPDIYNTQDVTIDNTKGLRDYYIEIFNLMLPYQDEIGSELAIVSGSQNNTQKVAALRDLVTVYQTLESETRSVSVPSAVVQYHVTLLNSYFHLRTAALNLSELDGNPVIGVVGLQQYNTAIDEFTQLLEPFQ